MRILILANSDEGLYLFRRDLILELIKKHFKIYISVPYGKRISYFREKGCSFIDTPINRRGINPSTDFKLFKKYRKMIKYVNPDLVITYTIKPNIYGSIAARLARKQYAVNITGLGTAFEKQGIVQIIVVNLYKYALKKAKIIFFENVGDRYKMLSLRCCMKEKTKVLNGAGVDTELYKYQPYPNNDIVKFLFIGRVMKEKGIDELFEAMKRLVKEGNRCSLDVIGTLEEDYKIELEKYEAEGWLKYFGYQEDVKPFIAACDCFVLPSYHEGMANTNLECASSGRPLITSNIPGCKEAVKNGSGYLCEPKNVESLYQAMKKMVETQRTKREEMGISGRKLMEQVFDKKIVVAETLHYLL